MIKAVIFDLNGVFLQSEYLTKRMHEKYGVSENKLLEALKKVMKLVRQPGIDNSFEVWRPYLEKLGLKITKQEFFNFWFSGEKLVPELLEYAKELRSKGIKVFILSNNFRERTEYYRKNFPEIFESVDEAYFSWETGFVKPDPKAYQSILQKNNLQPEECIYFDDSKENIEVAQSLGINVQKYENLQTTQSFFKNLGID